MKPGFMTGKYLVNLDSEEEGQIFISCAGGMSTKATFRFQREEAPKGYFFFEGTLKGLKGGHSGDDIEKKRANAIKILARFLYMEQRAKQDRPETGTVELRQDAQCHPTRRQDRLCRSR